MVGAARYGALNARIKTRAGGLPTPDQYRALLDAPHEAAAGEFLKGLGVTMPVSEQGRLWGWLVTQWLVPEYQAVLYRLSRSARAVLRGLLNRFELENVKLALRALAGGQRVPREGLLDLGAAGTVDIEALLRSRGIAELQAAVAGSPFAGPLQETASRLAEDGGLFAAESALDRSVYAGLWRAGRRYQGPGADQVRGLIEELVESVSLLWRVRYQQTYGLTAEAAGGLSRTAAVAVTQGRRRRLLEETASDQIRRLVKTGEAMTARQGRAMMEWETALWRRLDRRARNSLGGPPFGFGVVVGFLLLKETALRDLAVIGQGLALGLRKAELAPLLIHGEPARAM